MLYEITATLYFFIVFLLIILVLLQKSHGGFWSGPASNDSTIIFGGSGGTDILQKVTWFFGFIFLFGGLFLSIYRNKIIRDSKFSIKTVQKKAELKTENNLEKTEDNNLIEENKLENTEEIKTIVEEKQEA